MADAFQDKHLYEQEISSQLVYQGRVVTLHVKQVRLPDGKESKREIIAHPGAAAIVPVMDDGRIILVRQFRKAAERVLLEVPAGTLDHADEDVWMAAARELREETGYRPGKLERLGGIFVAPGYSSEYIHLFLAQELTHDPLSMDGDEFIEQTVLTLDEAIQKVMSGEIEDAKTVSSLFLAAKYLGR